MVISLWQLPFPGIEENTRATFAIRKLGDDGEFVTLSQRGEILDKLGGGFFGTTYGLQLEDNDVPVVLKTAKPSMSKALLRALNWSFTPFPSRIVDVGARHDYLAALLIHNVVETHTHGRVVTSKPVGYTLTGDGFAQIRERLSGRGPRFDLNYNEFKHFKCVQRIIVELGTEYALEQMGQVHFHNPFGMENLWRNRASRRWEWLDDLAAIRHTVYVPPWYLFPKFHLDIRQRVQSDEVTYNRIHVNVFQAALNRHRDLYEPAAYEDILAHLEIYDQTRQELDKFLTLRRSRQTIIGWEQRGKISSEAARAMLGSKLSGAFVVQLFKEGLEIGSEALHRVVEKITSINLRTTFRLLILHQPTIKEELMLEPTRYLHDHRLITDDELQQAVADVSDEDLRPYIVLTGLLFLVSQLHNLLEPLLYSAAVSDVDFGIDPIVLAISGFLIGWVMPSVTRAIVTYFYGSLTRIPIKKMFPHVMLPKMLYLSGPPRQAIEKSKIVKHAINRAAVRSIAKMTRVIPPRGGWTEEEIYVALWPIVWQSKMFVPKLTAFFSIRSHLRSLARKDV